MKFCGVYMVLCVPKEGRSTLGSTGCGWRMYLFIISGVIEFSNSVAAILVRYASLASVLVVFVIVIDLF